MPLLKGRLVHLQFRYTFAEQGGAQGTISLGAFVPSLCMLIGFWYRSTQTFTSGGAATVALGVSTIATTTFLPATAIASLAASGAVAAGADLQATPKYNPGAGEITITIGAADLTAGGLIGYVLGFQSDIG